MISQSFLPQGRSGQLHLAITLVPANSNVQVLRSCSRPQSTPKESFVFSCWLSKVEMAPGCSSHGKVLHDLPPSGARRFRTNTLAKTIHINLQTANDFPFDPKMSLINRLSGPNPTEREAGSSEDRRSQDRLSVQREEIRLGPAMQLVENYDLSSLEAVCSLWTILKYMFSWCLSLAIFGTATFVWLRNNAA